jgi:hypothetical protein
LSSLAGPVCRLTADQLETYPSTLDSNLAGRSVSAVCLFLWELTSSGGKHCPKTVESLPNCLHYNLQECTSVRGSKTDVFGPPRSLLARVFQVALLSELIQVPSATSRFIYCTWNNPRSTPPSQVSGDSYVNVLSRTAYLLTGEHCPALFPRMNFLEPLNNLRTKNKFTLA